ncbi:hypothetical protein V1523DRAFT_413216, partial [Lipomyces doorenjongii]
MSKWAVRFFLAISISSLVPSTNLTLLELSMQRPSLPRFPRNVHPKSQPCVEVALEYIPNLITFVGAVQVIHFRRVYNCVLANPQFTHLRIERLR